MSFLVAPDHVFTGIRCLGKALAWSARFCPPAADPSKNAENRIGAWLLQSVCPAFELLFGLEKMMFVVRGEK